jgi:uncharacterized oxidoreductase
MNLSNNTVLVTGGGSGIGLALASRFLKAGSKVIICGRRPQALADAKAQFPELQTIQCDVGIESERVKLAETMMDEQPRMNVLVNNAGIQNRPLSIVEAQNWKSHEAEISINLEAPMHLTMLFAPFLTKQKEAAIINITSGLAFVPIAAMPTYCATKAAMHSFSMSARWQLKDSSVKVFEVAPPGVQTDLGGKGLHDWGVPLDEFADFTMARICEDNLEFGYQFSANGMDAGADERKALFEKMNGAFR